MSTKSKTSYDVDTEARVRAVVGCKVEYDKLFRQTKVKLFDHNFPKSMMWHPETNERLWATVDKPIPGFDALAWPRVLTTGDLTCDIWESEDGNLIAVVEKFFATLMRIGSSKTKMVPFPKDFTVEAAKDYLKARLEPANLWDESKFGIWLIIGS